MMITKNDFWDSLNPFDLNKYIKARTRLFPFVLMIAGSVALIAFVLQVLKVMTEGS